MLALTVDSGPTPHHLPNQNSGVFREKLGKGCVRGFTVNKNKTDTVG